MSKHTWRELALRRSVTAMGTVLAANAAYTTYRFVKEANQLSPEERWGQGDRLALKNINTSRPGK